MEYSTDPVYWKNKRGKYVVLVSSDNPWYENTDTTEIMPVLKPDKKNIDLSANGYKSFGTVPRTDNAVQISLTQPEDGVEYFDSQNKKDTNIPIDPSKIKHVTSSHKIYDIVICIIILLILFQLLFLYV
jgi:hypothetical protein